MSFIVFPAASITSIPVPTSQGGTGQTVVTFTNLTSNVTGTLPVGNGGTGQTSFTANRILLGNGSNPLSNIAPGAIGTVLGTTDGITWTSINPSPLFVAFADTMN